MSKTKLDKQIAMMKACQKAGIDVAIRDEKTPFREIILVDDGGRKYRVKESLEVVPEIDPSMRTAKILRDTVRLKSGRRQMVYGARTQTARMNRKKSGVRSTQLRNSKIKMKG